MKKVVPLALIVLLLGVSGAAFYFYRQAKAIQSDPTIVAQKEAEDLVARVGKLIILPEGEIPTVATVSDPDALKGQAFFAKAKAGDKILLYQNALRAFLYDPVDNKVLEVAPINLGAGAATKASKSGE